MDSKNLYNEYQDRKESDKDYNENDEDDDYDDDNDGEWAEEDE